MSKIECVSIIITHFLFKNLQGNLKYNVKTSANSTSGNHWNAELETDIQVLVIPTKLHQIHYNNFKMSYNMCLVATFKEIRIAGLRGHPLST